MTAAARSRDALAAWRGVLTDNEICVAADKRAEVYDRRSASDADLATADRDFCEDVERIVLDALIASGAVVLLDPDDDAQIEVARKAIEDELIEWRDAGRFMICGNGFAVCEKDGSPSPIIRFRTDIGFRVGLRAMLAAVAEGGAR